MDCIVDELLPVRLKSFLPFDVSKIVDVPSPYEILINFKFENLNSIKNNFKIIENKEQCYLIQYLND